MFKHNEIDFEIKETMALQSATGTRNIAHPILLRTIKPKEEILTIH